MGAGTTCPMCGRHLSGPECRTPQCGYREPDEGLTLTKPRPRATDERPFTELVRESWALLSPETRASARGGIADAREQLRRAKERKGAAA